MDEKKSIKIGLGTVLCIMVIELLIIALVVMYFYYNNNSSFNNDINTSENIGQITESENKKINKLYTDKELIYSLYSKYSTEYSYSLPFININSAEINKINKEIEEFYMPLINAEIKNEKEGLSISMYDIKYTSYLNDNILSIVISDSCPNDCINYTVYNVDIYSGEKLSNSDLINLKNISESDYLNTLQTLCKNQFITKFGSKDDYIDNLRNAPAHWSEDELQKQSDLYEERYNENISTDNCSIKTPIFLNQAGNISVILCIRGIDGNYNVVTDINI